jgi:hypothetical protein
MQFFDLKLPGHRAIGASPSDAPVAIRAAPLPSVSRAIASEGFAFLFTKVRLPLGFPNPSEIKDSPKSWR